MAPPGKKVIVTYLIGAGATHGCADSVSSPYSILMKDLRDELTLRLREVVATRYPAITELEFLVNDILEESCDFEHIITFLDGSVSTLNRKFANDLREVFENVLRHRLQQIEDSHGSQPHDLYATLIDLHEIPEADEELRGVLTLNYDDYIENAITKGHGKRVDFGLEVSPLATTGKSISLVKLHGSFGWAESCPVSLTDTGSPLWIPPGIQKAKDRYPFNLLWGRARELLNCSLVRVIGCNLSGNDWDLVSMLFGARLSLSSVGAFEIEIIDAPCRAEEIKRTFPYLNVKSLLEIDGIGKSLIAEYLAGVPKSYELLTDSERATAIDKAGSSRNWFRIWLKQKAEHLRTECSSVSTPKGHVEALLAAAS